MKIAHLSVLAILALTAHGAFAQSSGPGSGMSSGMSSGSSSGSAQGGSGTDASSVTNAGSLLASDTTIEDTTTTSTDGAVFAAPTGEMANTGGEPQLMLLAGIMIASGGLLLRRKTGAQSL